MKVAEQTDMIEHAASAAKFVTISGGAWAVTAQWLFDGHGIALIGLIIGLMSFIVQAILGILQYRLRLKEHERVMQNKEKQP